MELRVNTASPNTENRDALLKKARRIHARQELARSGLGTYLAHTLAAIGYTRARHIRIKRWLGLSPTCGCAKREAWLNRFGQRLLDAFCVPVSSR
jgi:hypothetical protein